MRRQILLSHFASSVWAMEPMHLATTAAVLRRWSAGGVASPEVMADIRDAQAIRAARAKSGSAVGGGIVVLSLSGILSQKASMVDDLSDGGTSTDSFSQALNAAVADAMVAGIIIDINSPGGAVYGVGELASSVLAARAQKPIYGFVNSLCASAAYWIGAQCSQLYITPGGQAGSVGCYMQHVDESAALAAEGVKPTFISAGKFKTEGNSLGPLEDDARAALQSQVDAYYAMFIGAIARGRAVPVASVRGGFGEGRCLMAADALSAGMVDGICSFSDVVGKMQAAIKSGGARAALESTEIVAAEPAARVADDTGHRHRLQARGRALEVIGV